ncbi:ferritin-like domain-containing protein [Cytobacillus suaedae]|nr:ferritin-like domain-containing protein [Cytobacillus suaedae]
MNQEIVIKELNAFLKGQYMGIHQYEHCIKHLEDPSIRIEFQKIQQEHKEHASQVAERIQNLGGVPVDDEGLMGSIQNYMSGFSIPNTTEDIIKFAKEGEDQYGIHMSEEIVKGDLDPESKALIESILDKDRQHIVHLDSLIH